ncbi:MAG: diphthamide biosynthesis enzyme Dph2 [archaeon]
MFDFELDRTIQELKRRNVSRLLVQIPYGLRSRAFYIADSITKETSAEVIISADPCYGACDLATNEATQIEADMILHLGHAQIPEITTPKIFFVEARATIDISPVISEAEKRLQDEHEIGLMSTVQHVHNLNQAKQILESLGKNVVVPRASGKVAYDGQILGCDFGTAKTIAHKVEAFIVIGGGDFHGLGVQIATGTRTLVCDPFANEVRDMSDLARRFLRKRYAMIEAFKKAHRIGVLIVTKTGQLNLDQARSLRDLLEKKGHQCLLISAEEVRPAILESFSDIEAFVNTGCPRIARDDQEMFKKPVLTPDEALVAVGITQWKDYVNEDPTKNKT